MHTFTFFRVKGVLASSQVCPSPHLRDSGSVPNKSSCCESDWDMVGERPVEYDERCENERDIISMFEPWEMLNCGLIREEVVSVWVGVIIHPYL